MSPYTIGCSVYLLRILLMVLGLIILVIGVHSHYRSSWVSLYFKNNVPTTEKAGKMDDLCRVKYFYGNCPDIILEQFFVLVISIDFIFISLGFIAHSWWYRNRIIVFHPFRRLDLGYNVISSILLLAAAIAYLVSAVQIREFSGDINYPRSYSRTDEKFVAGSLTILQALLHIGMVMPIVKCKLQVEELEEDSTDEIYA